MRRIARAARAIAPGMLMVLPAGAAVWETSVRNSWATLGRDQGIFQYIAWAVARGDVLYRDVRDVNGPLVALLHRIGLALGGGDEHRFRVLDLVVTALAAAFAGGCLAALDERAKGGWERVLRELSLGAAAWAVLSAQYLAYGWWDTGQRESFFDWFVLASVGLQIVGQSLLRADTITPRRRRAGSVLLALGGAFSVMPWFGKPTFVFFTVGQALALTYDDLVIGRARRVALVAIGGLLGGLVPVSFLLLRGDPRAWARITFVDVPAMYRFIWPRSIGEILEFPGHARSAGLAVLASLGVAIMVATKIMPRRALVLAVMPLAGLASVAIQAKGFHYHFHPASAGASLALVAIVHQAWTRAERSSRVLGVLAAGAFAISVGARAAFIARAEYYPEPPAQRDPESLASEERLDPYRRVDFFPKGLRDAAAHVASHTVETDTVQTYGMDPYFLFLARRRSATPYIYAYDLDADAALAGGMDEGVSPTAAQARVIRRMRDEHERDLLARLRAAPPAAFVLIDRSPLLRSWDAERDFEEHCPTTFDWVRPRYIESASFEGIHVWLRLETTLPAASGD